jgi:hypothetical protein
LRLHGEEGGKLLHTRSDEPEVAFGWGEVEKMERVRVLGLPFLGEGVRVVLKGTVGLGVSRRFVFFTLTRGRTMDVLRFAESRGVRVEREAKNTLAVP